MNSKLSSLCVRILTNFRNFVSCCENVISSLLKLSVAMVWCCFFPKHFPFSKKKKNQALIYRWHRWKTFFNWSLAIFKLLTDCVNICFSHYQCINFKEARFVHAETTAIITKTPCANSVMHQFRAMHLQDWVSNV